MCLIACAHLAHPRFVLVLLANRDEFHDRATDPAAPDPASPEVIGGRDRVAGGSWLQLSTRGRLAAVTNVRAGAPSPMPRSRGALVSGFVRDDTAAGDWLARTAASAGDYGRFNLLLWQAGALHLASNHPHWTAGSLAPGLHVLSNARYGTPWPKTRRIEAGLAAWLADPRVDETVSTIDPCASLGPAGMHGAGQADTSRSGSGTGAATVRSGDDDRRRSGAATTPAMDADPLSPLFALLGDRSPAADDELPDTGVGLARERLLAPVFVCNPIYGTRCSSVVLVQRDRRFVFAERRFDADGRRIGESRHTGRVDAVLSPDGRD